MNNGKIDKQIEDETKKVIEELSPVAQLVIEEISKSKLPVGELHARHHEAYNGCSERILAILLVNNIRYTDRQFLFQLILQKLDTARSIAMSALEKSFNSVMDKALGMSFDDVRIKDIDDRLKEV